MTTTVTITIETAEPPASPADSPIKTWATPIQSRVLADGKTEHFCQNIGEWGQWRDTLEIAWCLDEAGCGYMDYRLSRTPL